MNMLKVKKSITLLVGMMTITAFSGIAQAETRFAVQDTTGTTDKMVVTDQGYVGVGNASPGSAFVAEGPSYNNSQIITHYNSTASNGGGGFIGYHNNSNGALPVLNDRLGYFYFGSIDGTTQRNAAGIAAYAAGPWVGGASPSTPASITFETTHTTGVRTERMRVTYYGYVGIGTISPQQKLDVNGAIRTANATVKPTCNATIRGTFWFYKNDTLSTAPDTLDVCAKDNTGAYVWKSIF